MTAPTTPPTTVAGNPFPPAPRPPKPATGRWIGWTIAGVVVGIVLLLLVLIAIGLAVRPSQSGPGLPLDPDNPGAGGAKALASVIDDHGVDVDVRRGLEALDDADRPHGDTTVVVSNSIAFRDDTASYFRQRVRDAHRIVILEPSASDLDSLHIPATTGYGPGAVSEVIAAGCSVSSIAPTDQITWLGSGYTTAVPGATACGPAGPNAGILFLPATPDRPETVLISGDILRNDRLDSHDNAGVAIRTIATTDHVLWYLPQFGDKVPAHEKSSDSDIPRAIGPLILLGVFAVLAAMLWRGRRFGPLVTEPLPAVVKAVETTQARGRLYHRARAITRAAATLRIHTLGALSKYLGLPYDPAAALVLMTQPDRSLAAGIPEHFDHTAAAIVEAVVAATGRDPAQVHALLAGPLPTTDDALVVFTSELTALEKEVRRTP